MALHPIRGLAICAGAGGLELGIGLALGAEYRPVCYVEREISVVAGLVARMEEGIFHPAPIWSDAATFDARPWRGLVDLLSAGFPCQPHSAAGKRLHTGDERWLWPDIERIIREVQPLGIFLENVTGLIHSGMGAVLASLAALGFDAEWGSVAASDVGDTQERDRLFILAVRREAVALAGCPSRRRHQDAYDERGQRPSGNARGASGALACAGREGLQGREFRGASDEREREAPSRSTPELRRASLALGDREGFGFSGAAFDDRVRDASRHDADRRCSIPLFPPGPEELERWAAILREHPDLAPGINREGAPAGASQSAVRRLADGMAYRTERLRAAGNGVVPLAAAVAFRLLAYRLGLWPAGGSFNLRGAQ